MSILCNTLQTKTLTSPLDIDMVGPGGLSLNGLLLALSSMVPADHAIGTTSTGTLYAKSMTSEDVYTQLSIDSGTIPVVTPTLTIVGINGTGSIRLPSPTTHDPCRTLKIVDESGASSVQVLPNDGETIFGTSELNTPYASLVLRSDGSNWFGESKTI